MLKIVSLVIAVLIAGMLVAAASKPDVFRVQRSASIKAPPGKIYPLIAKLIHLVVDMDAMVGKDFEAGLANLKTIAEQ